MGPNQSAMNNEDRDDNKDDGKTLMLQLLYQESRQRLNFQLQNLVGLRTRAGALFGAATVATSLLAGLAANAEKSGKPLQLGAAGYLALGCFLVAIVITLTMFGNLPQLRFTLPRRGLRSTGADRVEGVEDLLEDIETMPIVTPADAYEDVTTRLEQLFKANAKTMRRIFILMWVLAAAVGLELFAWMWVLTH